MAPFLFMLCISRHCTKIYHWFPSLFEDIKEVLKGTAIFCFTFVEKYMIHFPDEWAKSLKTKEDQLILNFLYKYSDWMRKNLNYTRGAILMTQFWFTHLWIVYLFYLNKIYKQQTVSHTNFSFIELFIEENFQTSHIKDFYSRVANLVTRSVLHLRLTE